MWPDKTEINSEAKQKDKCFVWSSVITCQNTALRYQHFHSDEWTDIVYFLEFPFTNETILSFFLAGQAAFTAFLKSEFSQENIEFWRACEDYKKTSAEKMATKAKQIFDQYVEMDSPNEVNIIFTRTLYAFFTHLVRYLQDSLLLIYNYLLFNLGWEYVKDDGQNHKLY